MYIPAAEVKKYALQGICFAQQLTVPTDFRNDARFFVVNKAT